MDYDVLKQAAVASDDVQMAAAIDKASAAGVPIMVILQWLIKHGPDLIAKIQELIDAWRAATRPVPMS